MQQIDLKLGLVGLDYSLVEFVVLSNFVQLVSSNH